MDDDADLDLVIGLARLALNRLDDLPADARAVMTAHGQPAVAMIDGIVPLDIAALREHLRVLALGPELVDEILGPDDASALEAIRRARALQVNRAWGRDDPRGDA
jgi:hypothetical protein